MRDEHTWNTMVLPKVLEKFSPRMQRDLLRIPLPKDLPTLMNYANLYIWGAVETGKSVLAAQILLAHRRQRYLDAQVGELLFISVPELILDMQVAARDATLHKTMDYLSKAAVVVLDDLGSEKPTEFVVSMLYLLINRRYESLSPTIITSNYDLNELANYLNVRIASRIERAYEIIKQTKKSWKT